MQRLMEHGNLAQVHMDVACKVWPWIETVLSKLVQAASNPETDPRVLDLCNQVLPQLSKFRAVRMVLSHAHGTLHSNNCQVRCSFGATDMLPITATQSLFVDSSGADLVRRAT